MTSSSRHTTYVRRPTVSVIGGQTEDEPILAVACALGTGLIDSGFRLATGGLGGVMAAASRGGRESGRWTDGSVVGVLPGLDARAANPFVDLVIPSGLNFARNSLLVAMADVVIAVGGGAGTLSEIALAWQHQKPVIALDTGSGWSTRLAGSSLDHRRQDVVHRATDVEMAVALALELHGTRGDHQHGF